MMSARPTTRRDRHAVAHRLAETGEVGNDAVIGLGTANRPTKAGDNLVEDQERAVPVHEVLQFLQIAGHWLRAAGRLDDEGRELVWIFVKEGFDRGEVAVGDHVGERRDRGWNAEIAGGCADVPVLPAVIAAQHDSVPACRGARQADRRRGGIGAILAEANHLRAGNVRDEPFCQLRLQLRGQAEADASRQLPTDRKVDIRVAIAEHVRQQRTDEIDIFVAVHIEYAAAIAMCNKERRGARRKLNLALRKSLRAERDDPLGSIEHAAASAHSCAP